MSSKRINNASANRRVVGGKNLRADLERRTLLSARLFADSMRSLYDDLERMTDASVGAHRALAVIASDGGLQASQLAARLGMRPPAVSQLLRLLVARGWVSRRRGAADQRIVRIYLTAAGRRVVSATSGRAVGVLYRAVRALSVDDLERLARSVPELVQRLPKSASGRPGA